MIKAISYVNLSRTLLNCLHVLLRLGILLIILLIGFSCRPKPYAYPNVILFVVDDLGWTDLSSYGSSFYQTPNVDKLAKAGVRFTDAYAACTVCSPTRASLLTGKYPARINCTDWIKGHQRPFAEYQVPNWTQHIRHEDITLAEALKREGYRTFHVGKWHLGEEEQYWPENHGFDINVGGWKMGMPKRRKKEGGYFTPYHNPRLEDGPPGEYLTERLTDEAINLIDQNDGHPFFLNFWLYNVHTPLQAKAAKVARYDSLVNPEALQSNPTYAAMVAHMDDALGRLIDELKIRGIYNNTLIIFTSDNGGLTGTRGDENVKPRVTSNSPLRSGKGDIYEGGVRVPLIISWPGHIEEGKETNLLSISPDVFPTIMGLIDAQNRVGEHIDGEDLSDFLLHQKPVLREAIFWHYPHYHTEGAVPYSAVRESNWKLIKIYGREDSLQLFNLAETLNESANLSAQLPGKAKELEGLLENWKKRVSAQDPVLNPHYDPLKAATWKTDY